jgi:hypothetical protein
MAAYYRHSGVSYFQRRNLDSSVCLGVIINSVLSQVIHLLMHVLDIIPVSLPGKCVIGPIFFCISTLFKL